MPADATKGPPFLGRRLLIFMLVGVPLGSILLLLTLPVVMNGNLELGAVYTDPASLPLLVLLPPFWVVGALPALLCGGVDARLAQTRLGPTRRAISTGCLAALLTLLPVLGLYAAGTIRGALPLLVGLAGTVAAITCSVLSSLADGILLKGRQ